MLKNQFSVQWYELVDGKSRKFNQDFDTKAERDTFMESLKSRPNLVEIKRFMDFEVLSEWDDNEKKWKPF
jgi:hypothetical protein